MKDFNFLPCFGKDVHLQCVNTRMMGSGDNGFNLCVHLLYFSDGFLISCSVIRPVFFLFFIIGSKVGHSFTLKCKCWVSKVKYKKSVDISLLKTIWVTFQKIYEKWTVKFIWTNTEQRLEWLLHVYFVWRYHYCLHTGNCLWWFLCYFYNDGVDKSNKIMNMLALEFTVYSLQFNSS